eukprot:CAMPEP_0194233122 /NCGR_PEP_ID=MMETSP0158-20130606/1202_1 /TAXON_ID=33649 /ORGANISM="Thalassionema nitzschioides, Strain L26-B" /LENGTH=1373 /DNA_ID=CAMNT_0038965965 /DNA_START=18 /DNA_END=4139 /DNA_ORIENTATION=+
MAVAAPRRSSRQKRTATTVYDDAKQEMKRLSESPKKRKNISSSPSRRSQPTADSDNDDSDDDDGDHEDEESSSSLSDEEEFVKEKKKPAPKTTKTPTKRTASTTNKRNVAKKKKSPKVLLRQLANKVLEQEETPETSLMAALLQHAIASKPSNDATFDFESFIRDSILPRDDAYEVQADLIHLLFRAVGGVHSPPYLDAAKLEDYNHDDWDKVTNQLVDDMRYTPIPFFLLSNYDWEQQHQQSMDMHQAFRQAWEAFWYQLVEVTLSSNDRFAMEMVKDWNVRLHELLEVSQPDIRAAAVMASMQMALSLLKLSCDTKAKLARYERQVKSCSSSQKKKKQLLLDEQVQPTKRWLEELETLVDTNFTAVFMNRYRDSNPVIRAYNLSVLTQMMVQRPDLYLRDKYLKYIGWTLSDKNAQVRCAAIDGLLAPYSDMDALQNVVRKFLPRLADCTIDVSTKVQEKSMSLFLKLAKASLLEDFDDDLLWEQINNRALAADTTAVVRRDALYFIMDQLEAFDDQEEEEQKPTKNSTWKRDKKASLVKTKEIGIAKKLSALASWVAHSLTNGPIPLEHLRLELTDYVIESLRSMGPEYSSLVTNQWSAFVRAIKDSDSAAQMESDEQRVQVATQRVLIRMLASAARAEFSDKKKSSDSYVMTLLPLMTNLLRQFQTDSNCLTNLASLCQYFISSDCAHHPKLKAPMRDMVQALVDIYGTIGDDKSMPVIIESLAVLMDSSQNTSTILSMCKSHISQLTKSLSQRLTESLQTSDKTDEPKKKKRKKRRSSTSTDEDKPSSDGNDEKESVIQRCLQRLSILAKRVNIQEFLPEDFRTTLIEGMTKRLEERQLDQKDTAENNGDDPMENIIPLIWQQDHDSKVHEACSRSVKYTLDFLLVSLAWDLYLAKKEEDPNAYDNDSDNDDNDAKADDDLEEYASHTVVQQRDELVEFLGTCFQQFLSQQDGDGDADGHGIYSSDQVHFSDTVQLAALQTCGDLRSLLPKIWSEARSPLLRAVALIQDQILIGGSIRFFRSKTSVLRNIEDQEEEDVSTVHTLLLPFGRSLLANWSLSNRREAGYVFTHFVGSGQAAQQLLQELSKMCKKMDPVRLMETHMASLRTSFDQWLLNEPEEIESEHPTDEEMAAFEQAEEAHQEEFELLLQQSKNLAQTLKPPKKALEAKLQDPMLAFLKEGIRFAFSLDSTDDEEDLLPGARLTFLLLLEYFGKLCKQQSTSVLREYWTEKVLALQQDADYDQAHQDDLEAMKQFAKIMGFPMVTTENVGQSPKSVLVRDYDDDEDNDDESSTPRRSSASRLSSEGGRRSSVARSSVSTALSPLLEEGGDDDDEETTPAKNRRSSVSMDTLEEEEEDEKTARSSTSADE